MKKLTNVIYVFEKDCFTMVYIKKSLSYVTPHYKKYSFPKKIKWFKQNINKLNRKKCKELEVKI